MPHRILLLDDNPDFIGLLVDIFRQSGHETVPFTEPEKALVALRAEPFDLLVTDHRMPGMSGEMLVRELRKTHPHMPVVVVSGFLDNDTIRDLVRDGVGGIFLKPLNVVNLLKRTAVLLESAGEASRGEQDSRPAEAARRLPFPFKSFPCVSAKSLEFAKRLHAKRAFKGALTLVTPPGTQLAEILDDLRRFEPAENGATAQLAAETLTTETLLAAIAAARGEPLTLAITGLERADERRRRDILDLVKRSAPFDTAGPTRVIFVLEHHVDDLYDRGLLDESLYLLASITEIAVPTLADCVDDIPLMADAILAEHSAALGVNPPLRLNRLASAWLVEHPPRGNHAELLACVRSAAALATGSHVTRDALLPGLDPRGASATSASQLARLRDDYVRAALILCREDTGLAAASLGIERARLDQYPKPDDITPAKGRA